MAYQSESALENKLIEQLVSKGYQWVPEVKSEATMIANFRKVLEKRNSVNIGEDPLTDKEFERLMTQINGKSIFDSAKILRDKVLLKRDSGKNLYLELFNTKEWCKNTFQITNQISMEGKYTNRYDVTILINGLPLVQVELKRSGVDMTEAFNQIMRYRKHTYTGLFRYIQIFVISNSQETRYFSNSDGEILKSHMFYWSDVENNRINVLSEFAESFMEKCHLAKMIARYMVLNETDKLLMVMRPYQVYAVEALVRQALETKNNGYIWHTTGSGKTLTSFKASQIIAQEESIEKVFFLVDRKDLDAQTLAEFNKFEADSVDMTDNTYKLLKQMGDRTKPLILTTIQKMANAVKSGHKAIDSYREDRVVFIIDECHRTQFGEMHKLIHKHFKNAQYFGFTGTPRFPENPSQDGRVTADIFQKCLHHYLIKDAIRDENVLGFSVEYISTFRGQFDEEDQERVAGINTNEVWMADERLEDITKHILKNHRKKTKNQQYTALFTVQSIKMAIKYYDLFKQYAEDINVASIFTYGANEPGNEDISVEHSRDSLERIMKDYNETFSTNFSTDNFNGYFADVSKRVKKGVPGERLDILIVVDMFLTGFDSKPLNTLYVDRNLKYHTLLQAYSRTNRIEKETKPYGNIVCYRNLKYQTDEAIKLYSQTNDTNTVLMASYAEYLTDFRAALSSLLQLAPTPESVDQLESEEDQYQFVVLFRELSKLLLKLRTFDEFEFSEDTIGIVEQNYQDFKSKYFTIYEKVKKKEKGEEVSILDNLDFAIEVIQTDTINVSYILNLIRNINLKDEAEREKNVATIHRLLDQADNEDLRLKADLIRKFLDKVLPVLDEEANLDEAYNVFEEEEREGEIYDFAQHVELEPTVVNEFLAEYEYSGSLNRERVSDQINGSFIKKRRKIDRIFEFVMENTRKFMSV
ncbi:type I restriction endonuclease subunit R, EcoR124 family [Trichococcus ilyis]|uniref:Type I restriction enzyme endonuclease subunit n=1 Tax=Trichococcus ilyis TaxID=640938 RepID=A0A143Z877_9LACT|nr:type I restriction endonuclease subunit R [Trichococcus ilyis]CZR09718.1 restriction endonuclease type i hsdr [Trichococcus ilyis]SEJ98089.1 type I restriction enzyme, R subunit [Trichococcus ilyis]